MYNQNHMNTVAIHHVRPGKETQIFREGFVSDDQRGLATFSLFSEEDTQWMAGRLRSQGFIEAHQVAQSVSKFYPRGESFNLLVFRDQNGDTLGYYSDMAMPLRKVDDEYEIVDLFLDIWLKPDGTLLELDWDEFETATSKGLVTEEQQTLAVTAMERLKQEAKQGLYPQHYIWTGL
jgi:predicted RNA-binding protein associated with RNAse of E/G family